MTLKVKKRNGKVVTFDQNKIKIALTKAFTQTNEGAEKDINYCLEKILTIIKDKHITNVEDIQDLIERTLMKEGYYITSKAFILYREQHKNMRELREIQDDWGVTFNVLEILKERYLLNGETPLGMLNRVAKFFGSGKKEKERFLDLFYNKRGLCNSPALYNANTPLKLYSACFVLPLEDSLEDIFETLKKTAILHKYGGGTGFDFSTLREKSCHITGSKAGSSGILSWLKIFNAGAEEIHQGGRRRAANMAVLNYTHPQILDFLVVKDYVNLSTFNLSMMIDDNFMLSLEDNDQIDLVSPHTKEIVKKIPAQQIFNLASFEAWKSGDPGVLFSDRINKDNYYSPNDEEITATNPCGESPLLPYESCNLGSLNISEYTDDDQLKYDTETMTILLNRIIDKNRLPFKELQKAMLATRKIGIGIMGFGDYCLKNNIVYGSEQSINELKRLLKIVKSTAHEVSCNLDYPIVYNSRTNTTLLSIAPTGTISTLCGCSFSIEPPFGWIYERRILDGSIQFEENKIFMDKFSDLGVATINQIKNEGTIQNVSVFSKEEKKVFRVAFEIPAEEHLNIQAAAQEFVDLGVSKTINMSEASTIDDVKYIFKLAWEKQVKGITIYRNNSKEDQPIKYKLKSECGTDRCSF